jgi:hypothetical protein
MFSRSYWRHRGTFAALASMLMTVLSGGAGLASENSTSIGGYYAMRVAGSVHSLPDKVFKKPGIAGIYLRYYWRDLEPSQGKFHWKDLDHDLERTLAAGKKFSIGIHTGGYSPSWLYAPGTGIRSIAWSEASHGRGTGCTDYTAPVPYDKPYAPAYTAMLIALRDHLAARNALPSLTMVKVTPFNDFTEELHLPSSPYKPGSCESDAQSAWLALGYRPSLVLKAFKKIYKHMAAIFPTTVLSFNTIQGNSFPGISEDGQKVRRTNDMAQAIIGYALRKTPGRVTVEDTALSNVQSSPRLVLWAVGQGAIQGWQSNVHANLRAGCPANLCTSTGYTQLVRNGIWSGAPYIEVWPRDAVSFSGVLVRNPLMVDGAPFVRQ